MVCPEGMPAVLANHVAASEVHGLAPACPTGAGQVGREYPGSKILLVPMQMHLREHVKTAKANHIRSLR
ncbi:hypothetical protein LCGC14_2761960, partial [marine sediment metagenome]